MADVELDEPGFYASFSIEDLEGVIGSVGSRLSTGRALVYEIVHEYLAELGATMVQAAEEYIEASDPAGRIYVRERRGTAVVHQASAPGQPPAVITERLLESFYSRVDDTPTGPVLVFGNSSPEIEYTELGTVKMAPRPVIRPIAERVLREASIPFSDSGAILTAGEEFVGGGFVTAGPSGHYSPAEEFRAVSRRRPTRP